MSIQQKIPKLRFPGFMGEWEGRKLGEIATFFSGGTPLTTKKEYFQGTIPFIKSGEMNSLKTEQFLTEDGLMSSSAKLVNKGDLLYALYGATSGEVAISKLSGAINQAVLCVRTDQIIYFLYSYFLFKKDDILNTYLQGGQGNLSAKIIKNLKFYFPTLLEQQKIAHFLTAIDEKINQLTRQKALLEQYKKGVMQQIFSRELRFRDADGKAFGEWEVRRLGEMAEIIMGQSPDGESYNTEGLGTPLINGPVEFSIKNPVKIKWTTSPTKYCQDKDILFCVRGSTTGKMNIANDRYCIGRGIAAIRGNNKNSTQFLEFFLIQNLDAILTLTSGSTFLNLDSKSLKEFSALFPTLPEQQKIANFLTALDEKIARVAGQVEAVKGYKKGLLQGMFV
jgi:type I restriction enzyme S subunit